jgi:alpha-N-arabinofuranosidase
MSQSNSLRVTVPGVPSLAKTACSIVFALAAVTAVAQTSGQPVTATIDASKTGKTAISPYLYGQFVEHAGGLVYTGLSDLLISPRDFWRAVKTE